MNLRTPEMLASYKEENGDMIITVKDEGLKAYLKVAMWQYSQAMQNQNGE